MHSSAEPDPNVFLDRLKNRVCFAIVKYIGSLSTGIDGCSIK